MYTGLGDRVDNLNEELMRTKELMGLLNEQDDTVVDSTVDNTTTDETEVTLPDGKYMLRGNNEYKILTRPANWVDVYIIDGKDANKDLEAVLTDEHEDALFTGYITKGKGSRCPCNFEYNAVISGGKLTKPSGGEWDGSITKGSKDGAEAGSGNIATPEGQEVIKTSIMTDGIENIPDAMIKKDAGIGEYEGTTITYPFGGDLNMGLSASSTKMKSTIYKWDFAGVEGIVPSNSSKKGYVVTGWVKDMYPTIDGEKITDAVENSKIIGFYSKDDSTSRFLVYTSTSGIKAYNAKFQ